MLLVTPGTRSTTDYSGNTEFHMTLETLFSGISEEFRVTGIPEQFRITSGTGVFRVTRGTESPPGESGNRKSSG